ncbi:MAG: restriction endonuclease subunit S [Burkholderiales bacterium]
MNWRRARLVELCEVRVGRTPRRDTASYWGGRGVWVTIGELNGQTITDSNEHVSELAIREVMPPPIPPGTLLFSFKLSIGKTAITGIPLYTNEAIAALPIRDPSIIDRDYLRYALRVPDFTHGAHHAVLGKLLNKAKVEALEIPVPPMYEQRRIVDILSRAEAIIRLQRQAVEKAREIIPALFLDVFGDPITGHSRWPLVKFDSVTRRITYGFTCPMRHLNSGIPIVTAKNVLDGWMDFENIHFADKTEFDSLTAKSKPMRGDILVTKDGTIGRCAVVEVDFQFCINQSVALVQPNTEKVIPTYLTSYLLYPSVADRLQHMGKGQALKHLQITELAKLLFPLPPLRLQQSFAERVNDVRGILTQRDVSQRSGESLFQALLAQAFAAR